MRDLRKLPDFDIGEEFKRFSSCFFLFSLTYIALLLSVAVGDYKIALLFSVLCLMLIFYVAYLELVMVIAIFKHAVIFFPCVYYNLKVLGRHRVMDELRFHRCKCSVLFWETKELNQREALKVKKANQKIFIHVKLYIWAYKAHHKTLNKLGRARIRSNVAKKYLFEYGIYF